MKRNFRTLVASSLTLVAMAMLTGCGGGGANTSSNFVATDLAQSYTVEIIKAPAGGTSMQISAMSQNGDMVGTYEVNNIRHVFRYKNGIRTDVSNGEQDYNPTAISESGIISGYYEVGNDQTPFSIKNSQITDEPMIDHSVEGWSAGCDSSGKKILSYRMDDGTYRACRMENGASTPLDYNGNANIGINAVSPDGHLLGWAMNGQTITRTAYNPLTASWTEILGGSNSPLVRAINDSGSFVGAEKIGADYVPFVEVAGNHINPSQTGAHYGSLIAINAGNVAVGQDGVMEGPYSVYHAFGWSQNSGHIDLNTRITGAPGFTARVAYGIDRAGRIVGYGSDASGQVGFILTPVKN